MDTSQHSEHRVTVDLLFGGKSAEHEMSLQSAGNVPHALDKERLEQVLIKIEKQEDGI